ncbi:hypothetical protein DQ04_00261040 [Trypanosoma grayi]|uniref:hypothetical protein n=1 Tax=Trypanosoma grayi TaxID=71804 RepID=UPI0004F47815|nr:hypothetical protein DQ04_00261040 [Trypanosoma grayi]KEG14905.1 hypothetical protein DQ04_00261040 [Trypanosoma grayi]
MGRGKGRAKGIDVTKHFFQPSGPANRISVQITASHTIHVGEEDLSPTQGSEAAFALKREGRMEGPMKLCTNWRQGACHSHAACTNAHVAAYFNSPTLPLLGGVNTASTPVGSPVQLSREDGSQSTSPQRLQQQHPHPHHHQQQQQQHSSYQQQHHHHYQQQTQQLNNPSADPARGTDHKGPVTSTHSTLIPAPRSQQASRQAASLSGSAVTMNPQSGGTSWSRNVAVNSSQQGNSSNISHHQQQPHHDLTRQQHSATQCRGGWVGHVVPDDDNRTAANVVVADTVMDAVSHKHLGKNIGGRKEIHSSTINTGPVSSSRGGVPQFTQSESLAGALGDDAWVSSTLSHSNATASIWGDAGTAIWDLPPPDVPTTTVGLGTASVTAEGSALFSGPELNTTSLVPSRGELWVPFTAGSGETAVSSSKVGAAPNSPETLTSQLLRSLVGEDGATGKPQPAQQQEQQQQQQSGLTANSNRLSVGASICPVESRNASELLSLLGGTAGGISSSSTTPNRSVNTIHIQHLMSLLTTE